MIIYRLSFELVNQGALRKYSDADPTFYKGTTQTVPNSQIPDEDWHPVSKETGDPWQQYHQLRKWEKSDTGFVRNVVLEQAEVEPTQWEPVRLHITSD